MRIVQISPNFLCLRLTDFRVWFSYETPIAIQLGHQPALIRKNDWSRMTGKHINAVKSEVNESYLQVSGDEFIEYLNIIEEAINVNMLESAL